MDRKHDFRLLSAASLVALRRNVEWSVWANDSFTQVLVALEDACGQTRNRSRLKTCSYLLNIRRTPTYTMVYEGAMMEMSFPHVLSMTTRDKLHGMVPTSTCSLPLSR